MYLNVYATDLYDGKFLRKFDVGSSISDRFSLDMLVESLHILGDVRRFVSMHLKLHETGVFDEKTFLSSIFHIKMKQRRIRSKLKLMFFD